MALLPDGTAARLFHRLTFAEVKPRVVALSLDTRHLGNLVYSQPDGKWRFEPLQALGHALGLGAIRWVNAASGHVAVANALLDLAEDLVK